ncbi:unnamed protein product [Caenorhabditis bovis]|uniref:PDZ domain-containing protein n=1 Tax=Caenorhabditis bovis TaxID=2654633 RepID=A0A8S1ESN3_9PELO|nr:unnamed protein product [Caenorhabditis bovis]
MSNTNLASPITDIQVVKKIESMFGKKFCYELLDVGEASQLIKKGDGLGLELRQFFIVSINYNSPFLGSLKAGDIVLSLNGQHLNDVGQFVKIVQNLQQSPVPRAVIKYIRLKRRISRPVSFPPFQKQEGYSYETAVIYNMKGIFHLGLDLRDIDGKLIVCHMIENSLSDLTFSLGEAIIDIDGEIMLNLNMFHERLKKSLEIRKYALCLMEIPATDMIKNMIRNKIAAATKEIFRVYPIPQDCRQYALEGISVLRRNIEPKPILTEEKAKHPSARLKMQEKVREMDVPSSWNSMLFVKILPAKTVESENGG